MDILSRSRSLISFFALRFYPPSALRSVDRLFFSFWRWVARFLLSKTNMASHGNRKRKKKKVYCPRGGYFTLPPILSAPSCRFFPLCVDVDDDVASRQAAVAPDTVGVDRGGRILGGGAQIGLPDETYSPLRSSPFDPSIFSHFLMLRQPPTFHLQRDKKKYGGRGG